ncbi:MAG: hydroxymethylglutaryl-CoA lyase [Deltaproteobacteria bacterium]|nr:hydroxymethylglutaryl-CoA lyase [Deltaproteobacteria bacterium]
MQYPDESTVLIQEVSTRDGLQNEPNIVDPSQRIQIINALVKAGLRRVQIGSFVNPHMVPQMAGSDAVWRGLEHNNRDVRYTVLILNEKGFKTALDLKVSHIEIYVSASETHSLKNSRMSVRRALDIAVSTIRLAREARIEVTGGIMCAFGCSFEGLISKDKVCQMVSILLESGATEIALADTTGMAKPDNIRSLVASVGKLTPLEKVGLHIHDTQGYGLANIQAGIESGIRKFDSSVGGIGGCPFIPGAKGNVDTEKAVRLIEGLGFKTGIDLEKLKIAESILKSFLHLSVEHDAIGPKRKI